jgi:hypothetical protein
MIINILNWVVQNDVEFYNFITSSNWTFEVKAYKKDRTNEQNRYLRWVVYKIIADYIWEDVDYIHWVLSMKFLVDKTKKMPYIKSTTKLNTIEFWDYIEKIKNFVSTYWILIPDTFNFNN